MKETNNMKPEEHLDNILKKTGVWSETNKEEWEFQLKAKIANQGCGFSMKEILEDINSHFTSLRAKDREEMVKEIEEIFPEIPESTYVSEPTRMLKELRKDILKAITKQ